MNKSESSNPNIIIAAGGTGGDLFPAIAVLEELQNFQKTLFKRFAKTIVLLKTLKAFIFQDLKLNLMI